MELGIAPLTAATEIRKARDLVARLPETLKALEKGEIDHRRAQSMAELTKVLSEEDAQLVEKRVLERGPRSSLGAFREAVRVTSSRVDSRSREKREKAARDQRDVYQFPCFDGMAELSASLTEQETTAAKRRIDELARKAKTKADTRSHGQRQADVVMDLVLGPDRFQVMVNATISSTILELLNAGGGPERARKLMEDPKWRRIISHPTGNILVDDRRRRASPALTRYIHARDRTCRVPGCSAVAERSEIDHTIRHADHGVTGPANTGAYCRFHNLWKERSSWTVTQPTPGTFTFTSPEGRVYNSTPEPYEEP